MLPCLHLLINATPTNTFFEPHNLPKEGAKVRILIGLEPFFYEKKLKKSPIAVATKGDGLFFQGHDVVGHLPNAVAVADEDDGFGAVAVAFEVFDELEFGLAVE